MTPGAAAFTLLEVLVVLALIGLISALLIGSSGALLKSIGRDDIETTALTAIAATRHSAVLAGHQQDLHYDDQTRTLSWDAGAAALTGDGTVRLLPAVKTSAMLVGGQAVEPPLSRVRFYADGTCDPFRLEIAKDNTSRILSIDPWTCTPLSPEATPNRH
jgi:prepilin-type N-terminal cleavage/methylation domain-containing protein